MRLAMSLVVHPTMNLFRTTVSTFAFLGSLALAQPALADGTSAKPDLVGEAERWLTAAAAGPTAASDLVEPSSVGAEHPALMDLSAPSLSVVARDWHGSMRLMGDRTLVLDDLRATASNRMVLTRLATEGRLSTFVQVGVGEWRIDPAMFPNARSYSEIAGQLGGGFELRLSSSTRIASEVSYTALYRDLHYTSDEVAPRMLAFAVAIDGRF
jgi:hypothetical protein